MHYSLKTPVTYNGATYTSLTFRKPKTGDMMVLDNFKGDTSKMVALLATISDVPIPVFKEIDFDDFVSISEAVAPLLGNGLASTGDGSI